MKKILLTFFILLIGISMTNAQKSFGNKETSTSYWKYKTPKEYKQDYFFVKAGGGATFSKYDETGTYDIEVGYLRNFGSEMAGTRWGVQLGSTLIPRYDSMFALYIGPSIGWNTNISGSTQFDINVEANLALADSRLYALGKLQPGLWFGNFYVGPELICILNSGGSVLGVCAQIGLRF